MQLRTRRIYEPADPSVTPGDYRVLIDRLWPRGIAKADARIDLWAKDLAPSHDLRKWFNHDLDRYDAFAQRYREELFANPAAIDSFFATLRDANPRTVTLLYAARDDRPHHAPVLLGFLAERIG